MRLFFLQIIIYCLLASPCLATNRTVSLTWEPGETWQTAAGGSYLDLDIDEVAASRRLAIRFYSYKTLIAEIWDNPTDRNVNISFDMGSSPISHIRGQAVAYECGPWKAGTAFSLEDKVCNGSAFPSARFSMVATTAGTSGTEEPEWPLGHPFYLALADTIDLDGVAVDNGDGTVGIPVAGHLYHAGESVVIAGSVAYDGTHILPDQSFGGEDVVVITATYAEETFLGTETIARAGGAVVDNGDGTVDIPCPGHGFESGQDVTISGTTNYDGTYTIGTQADPDWLTITATYVAEQITGGHAMDYTVTDGTVVWTFTTADPELTVLESEPTRRIIGRVDGSGNMGQSGTKFRLGNN
jgi:hypothetical protein